LVGNLLHVASWYLE